MSGGHFDYQQYRIRDIADKLEQDINGRDLDEEDINDLRVDAERGWVERDFYEYCKEHKHIPPGGGCSPDTLTQFKIGYRYLRLAEVYAQRIDWLLSGDDGEESFHERLKEDLAELKQELDNKQWRI